MQILVIIGLQNCPLYNIICGKEFLYKFTVCVTSEFRISVSFVFYGQKPGDCWPRVKIRGAWWVERNTHLAIHRLSRHATSEISF